MRKTAIIGSNNITDYDEIAKLFPKCETIVGGGHSGFNAFVEIYAMENNINLHLCRLDGKKHGYRAIFVKLKEIASIADEAVVVWNCKSNDMRHFLKIWEKTGKPLQLIFFNVATEKWDLFKK